MATLAELTERVLRMESQGSTNDTNTRLAVRDAINEAYRKFNKMADWPWLLEEATLSPTVGDETVDLPADFGRLLSLNDSDGNPLSPRSLSRHMNYKSKIANRSIKTYAVKGRVAGVTQLGLVPAASGDLTLYYVKVPTALSADADVPEGIEEVGDYLVHQSRVYRLFGDEERMGLLQQSEKMAMEALSGIVYMTATTLRPLAGLNIPVN